MRFNVVFKHKETSVITWTSYQNEAVFETAFHDHLENDLEVIAKGYDLTDETCVKWSMSTPPSARIKAALKLSETANGDIDEDTFAGELQKALYAISKYQPFSD